MPSCRTPRCITFSDATRDWLLPAPTNFTSFRLRESSGLKALLCKPKGSVVASSATVSHCHRHFFSRRVLVNSWDSSLFLHYKDSKLLRFILGWRKLTKKALKNDILGSPAKSGGDTKSLVNQYRKNLDICLHVSFDNRLSFYSNILISMSNL